MKRASSPPDATFISGPARVPGLVSHPELDPVDALAGRAPRLGVVIRVEKRAFSSFSGLSSPFTALSRTAAALTRALLQTGGERGELRVRLLARTGAA